MSYLGGGEGVTVVGHRGGRGESWPPENTLPAFERARREGAQAVELDVRLCGSGEVVVLHDPGLDRMTGGRDRRRCEDLTWTELRAVSLGPVAAKAEGRVPLLAEVLAWAEERGCALNVEIKRDVRRRAALVRAVAKELVSPRVPVVVSSFDPALLAGLAVLRPSLPRALLTDPSQRYAPALHRLARPPLLTALHVERRQARPERVRAWKQRGLAVGVWTVNDAAEARALRDAGASAIITDDARRILDALG